MSQHEIARLTEAYSVGDEMTDRASFIAIASKKKKSNIDAVIEMINEGALQILAEKRARGLIE